MTDPVVRVNRTPGGRWEAHLSFGVDPATGKRIRKHVRAGDEAALAQKIRDAAARPPTADGPAPTVAAWLDLWVAANPAAPETMDKRRWAVDRWLKPAFGTIRVDALTPGMVEARLATMTAPDSAGRPVRATVATRWEVCKVLRAALGHAVTKHRIPTNPAADAVVPRPVERPVRPLSVDEVRAVLRVVAGRDDEARWLAGILLGLRQSEALGLWWDDVDLVRGVVHIRAQLPRPDHRDGPPRAPLKTRASNRDLALPPPLWEALAALRARESGAVWVFHTAEGRPLDQRADSRRWKAILREAGLPDTLRVHDMRHTAASALLEAGVSDRAAQLVMGWAGPAMAARYQHRSDTVVADAVGRASAWLTGEPPPSSPRVTAST